VRKAQTWHALSFLGSFRARGDVFGSTFDSSGFPADLFLKPKNRDIMPFWVFDLNRTIHGPGLVKLCEFRPKAPCFDTNDRISPRVVRGGPVVNLDSEAIFFQSVALTRKSALDGEFQKPAQLGRS